jgi:hypothetical protein
MDGLARLGVAWLERLVRKAELVSWVAKLKCWVAVETGG